MYVLCTFVNLQESGVHFLWRPHTSCLRTTPLQPTLYRLQWTWWSWHE